MVLVAPPTPPLLAFISEVDRNLPLRLDVKYHDGAWNRFLPGINHTVQIAIHDVGPTEILGLGGFHHGPKGPNSLAKRLICSMG